MPSWAERLETAVDSWKRGNPAEAAEMLREIVVSGDETVTTEASHTLGSVLQDLGDTAGAQAAHRAVITSGHPEFAQRSAVFLGLMLADDGQWALAHRPLSLASAGADADIAAMADISLAQVLRKLGDLTGSAEAAGRARRSGSPELAGLHDLDTPDWPDDDGERERQARQALEAIEGMIADPADEHDEVVVTGLNQLLCIGVPDLCSRAAFLLYPIYAERQEFDECRRVVEHAIAVGDPAERCRASSLLGAALFDLGEYADARDAYRRAAEDHRPEIRLDALIQQSKFSRELGDEDEARALLWRVVESGHPRFSAEARACLGQVYSEAGEVADALACWRVVLDGDPDLHLGAVRCLGMLLHGRPPGDPRRAEIIAVLQRATELDDPDVAFHATMTLSQAEVAARGPDEQLEQAVDDCDAALERLRAGDLATARDLLRRVVDAGIDGQSPRAARILALVELGEGDTEQAEELLDHVAAGEDFAGGFAAALDRHLIASDTGAKDQHPVLTALLAYQRLGRDAGIARYTECGKHPDPAVAALANSMLAQVYLSLGVPRSSCVELLREAATGDPLALSHAAVLSWLIRGDADRDEVIALLRRAGQHGHPALAPWVRYALGKALDADGNHDEAVTEYQAVAAAHPGLRVDAEADLVRILEARRDLAGVAALHERIVARGDALRSPRSAWLLGLTRVRMDDLDAARDAFALVPEDHPELAEDGAFARMLLDGDGSGAARRLAAIQQRGNDHRAQMVGWLTIEAAHAWHRAGEPEATEAALSLLVASGLQDRAQEAALFLGALRNDAGDQVGAARAWARAAAGEDEHRAAVGAKALGEVRHKLGDLTGAIDAYQQALDAADPSTDDYDELEEIVLRLLVDAGRISEARARFTAGPQTDLQIGKALEGTGDPVAAEAAYLAAFDAASDYEDTDEEHTAGAVAGMLLARLLAGRGAGTRAVEVAGRATAMLASDDVTAGYAAYELAGYLAAAGDTAGARRAYQQAADCADPDIQLPAKEKLGTATRHERAWLRLRLDDRPAALRLLTEEYGDELLAELDIELQQKRLDRLPALLERAAATAHRTRAAGLVLTAALEGTVGVELCELVIGYGDAEQVAIACDNLGHAQDLAGDTDAAVRTLTRGAAVDHPNALACLRRLLGVMAPRGDDSATEAAARRAKESGDPPTVCMGLWTLADLARAAGDRPEAARLYRDAIEQHDEPAIPYLRIELAGLLHAMGDVAAAHRELETVLGCDDHGPVLLAGNLLGGWLAADDKLAGAAEAFGAAAAAGISHQDPDEDDGENHRTALNNLAVIAERAADAGTHTVALRALHLAAAGGAPGDAVAIAKQYAAEGDIDAARVYYKGAAMFPPHGDQRLLVDLAEYLAEHGATAEARALLEPLTTSADPLLRLAATTRLLPILTNEGEADLALQVAAKAAGRLPEPAAAGDPTGAAPDAETAAAESPAEPEPAAQPEPQAATEPAAMPPPTAADPKPSPQPAPIARPEPQLQPEPQAATEPAQPGSVITPKPSGALGPEGGQDRPAQSAIESGTEPGPPLDAAGRPVPGSAERQAADHAALRDTAWAQLTADALDEAEQSGERAVASGDPETVAFGYRVLGNVRIKRGDPAGAVTLLRQGLLGAEGLDAHRVRLDLARALHDDGEAAAAIDEVQRVRADADDTELLAKADSYLGNFRFLGGDLAGALEVFGDLAVLPAAPVADMVDTARNNVLAIAIEAGRAGDRVVAAHGIVLATRTEQDPDGAALKVAGGVAAGDAAGAIAFLRTLIGVDTECDGLLDRALAGLVDANDQEPADAQQPESPRPDRPKQPDETPGFDQVRQPDNPQDPDEAPVPEAAQEPDPDEAPQPVRAQDPDPAQEPAEAQDLDPAQELVQATEPGGAGEPSEREESEEAQEPGQAQRPDQQGVPGPAEEDADNLDSLRSLIRDQSGTPNAAAAGRRIIKAAQRAGDTPGALAMLRLVVEYGDPEEVATAYREIGDLHGRGDDMDAAVAAYRSGAEVDHPAALAPLRDLLAAQLAVDDYDGVADTAQRAVTTGDTETVAFGYWLWGDSRRYRGDTDAAVRLYRRGIEAGHDGLTASIRIDLARTLHDRGDGDQARVELGLAAAATEPEVRAGAGNLLGKWEFEGGELRAAADAFGRVAAIEVGEHASDRLPQMIDTAAHNTFVVANTAFAAGQHQVAAHALTLAAGAGKVEEAFEAAGRHATQCAQKGDDPDAMRYVEAATGFSDDPGPELQIKLADLYLATGDADRARAGYQRLVDHPDAEVRLVATGRLAPLLREPGDPAPPQPAASPPPGDAARAEEDTGARALLGSVLGNLQEDQGDSEGALRTLRTAAESGEPTALYSYGLALTKAGSYPEAREVLTGIADQDSRLGSAATVLLGTTYQQQDPDRARELFLRVAGSTRETGTATLAKMHLGAMAKQHRDWPEALRWYGQVVDSGASDEAPLAAAHLGELAYWRGDRDSATRYYELTLATGTKDADLVGEAAYRLGELRFGDGDLARATGYLRRAIDAGDEAFAEQARTLLAKLAERGDTTEPGEAGEADAGQD